MESEGQVLQVKQPHVSVSPSGGGTGVMEAEGRRGHGAAG